MAARMLFQAHPRALCDVFAAFLRPVVPHRVPSRFSRCPTIIANNL
jgi:hypothetical protein